MKILDLSEQDRRLIRLSKIDVLILDTSGAARTPAPRGTVSTTEHGGAISLARLDIVYGRDDEPGTISLYVTPRARLADAGTAYPGDDPGTAFLRDGAMWMLATNSLELSDGAAERLERPLSELLMERHEQLPRPQCTHLGVDGRSVLAQTVAYGQHTVWWIADATPNSAVVVYAWSWPDEPVLRSAVTSGESPPYG